MSFDPVKIVDADTLEKINLTKQIAGFFNRTDDQEKRATIENVARALAQDVATQVRVALAMELRSCPYIPHDLAARIASDIEDVSGPFLTVTAVFSDSQLAGLIPHLEEHAHVNIAQRKELGETTCDALVTFGSEKSVSHLVRNKRAPLNEVSLTTVVKRFPDRQELMDQLSERPELPISVVTALMDKVTDKFRCLLEGHYGLTSDITDTIMEDSLSKATWDVISKANETQIHTYVRDLRMQNRLTMDLTLNMASRGSIVFLESALAFRSGLTLVSAREMLRSRDLQMFVALMQKAEVAKANAQMILEILKAKDIW